MYREEIKVKKENNHLMTYKTGQNFFRGSIIFSLLFTLIIWIAGHRLTNVALLPDQGLTWYYWKLPDPTFWSQATAWTGYIIHQLFMWGLIYYARKNIQKYVAGLHPINVIALSGNAIFVILHFIQTQIWYDGLAQNVSLQSSEVSVVLLLVIVLIMENQRRGLFFGKTVSIGQAMINFFKRNHGYIFAWAIVYTFWFHPMVNTPGHLVGFFYIFLLLIQSSLFYTRLHINRWWTVTLELIVLGHGAMVVAMLRGEGMWAFILGFMGIFLITQMHGLALSKSKKWGFWIIYGVMVLMAFSGRGSLVIRDLILIPIIEYGLIFVLALIFGFGVWMIHLVRKVF